MSTNHTTNYDLCQWEATDQVLRTDFNKDNAKIDAALNTLSGQVAGKAESSTVSALSSPIKQRNFPAAGGEQHPPNVFVFEGKLPNLLQILRR